MNAVTILSTLRMGVGTALLAAPNLTTKLFFLPPIADATIPSRFAGGRDLAIGALTFYAFRHLHKMSNAAGESRAQETASLLNNDPSSKLARDGEGNAGTLRAVLATNIAVDAMDILSCLWGFGSGNLGLEPALMIGGGADVFLTLGLYTLWRMKRNPPTV